MPPSQNFKEKDPVIMKQLSNMELSTFFNQLTLILRSGISYTEGITLMLEDTPSKEGQEILSAILQEAEYTGSLSQALKASSCFPDYAFQMTALGEQTGHLDDVTNSLGEYYQHEESLWKNIKNAVTYPLFMMGMMGIVLLILVIKVLPIFHQVFDQLGGIPSGLPGKILELGTLFEKYSIAVVISVFLLGIILFYFLWHRQRFSKLLPRHILKKIALSRFASGMYLSLSSGFDIEKSLSMISELVENKEISAKIQLLQKEITEGNDFLTALKDSELFSGVYLRLIHIGFKTGSIDSVMKEIAIQCNEDVEEQLDRFISNIEPTLIAVLCIIVGMILLSVMLPLLSIISNIG